MSFKKITGNETPRPLRGKTYKDSRNVRFVDLNATASEIVEHIEENFIEAPANPQNGDTLVYNSTTGEWENTKTFKRNFTASEVRSLNSSPVNIEIAPQGSFIDAEIFIRFNTGASEFNFPGDILIGFGSSAGVIGSQLVNNLVSVASNKQGDKNLYFKISDTSKIDPANGLNPFGNEFTFKALVGDATLGDSTLDILVKYKSLIF